jgi:hypothetical protein
MAAFPGKLSTVDFLAEEEEENLVPPELRDIFEEVPVDLATFIRDPRYLDEKWELSDIQWEAVRMIERIYFAETYKLLGEFGGEYADYWAVDLDVKNLIVLQWGKGSGKDLVCQIASLRVAYLLLCLKSPQEYFDLPTVASIHLLNIAVNAAQAERAFFDPVRRAVRREGSWFYSRSRVSRETIIYDKNILAISGHSDAESQEGLNILLGVADEIDAFREREEMIGLAGKKRESSTSAESILKMIEGSAASRFPKTYKRVAISYPRYIGSTIQKLTAQARASIAARGKSSNHYASGPHTTWEVNPRIKGPEDFAEKYAEDPVEAASMYECKPARAVDGYFKNMPALRAAVERMDQPITVEYVLKTVRSRETDAVVQIWDAEFHFADWFKPKQGARYAMHGDLALTGDRAGIAMSHVEHYLDTSMNEVDEEGGISEKHVRVPVIRNDFTIAFESSKATVPPREIQIRWAKKLAFELVDRGFIIALFSFDQFQSADMMQQLNDHGIETDRISADINDNPYKTLRDVAYDYRLKMPYSALLFDELERLNRFGKKIDHPPGGSKDLADALACSLVGAISTMGEETVDGKEVDTSVNKFQVGAAMAPLAGMGNTNMQNMMPLGMKGMSLYG